MSKSYMKKLDKNLRTIKVSRKTGGSKTASMLLKRTTGKGTIDIIDGYFL